MRRLRDRQTPQVDNELTPANDHGRCVRVEVSRENERRIAVLRNSLTKAHEVLDTQHSFARLDGYAAAHFEKER